LERSIPDGARLSVSAALSDGIAIVSRVQNPIGYREKYLDAPIIQRVMDVASYREQIYEIFADPGEEIEGKIDRALDVGTRYLGMPLGFLTKIDDGTQRIVQVTGDHPLIQPDETCPLDEAYCRRTVETDGALAVQDAEVSTAISDAAVRRFDLGTYIGAKITVNDAVYGTVCFADEEQRSGAFTDAETFFVELIARLVGQTFERRKYERELTERKERLNKQREIYRAVIDASFDFVFRIDPDGRFTYNSPTVTGFLGYTPAELDGRPITMVLPDERTTERAWNLVERVLNGETVQRQDFQLGTKSGATVYADIRATPIYDGSVPQAERSSHDVVAIQGMARDVTERRKRERLISVINRVLRHNLRNEMTLISGYAEMLVEELDDDLAAKAELIETTADRLLDLSESAQRIEANRDLSPELEPIDVAPLVERVLTQLETRYPDASVSSELPETAVAETLPRVEVALWELLDNAAKHGGDPASIAVETAVEDAQVRITIADEGPGIPEIERTVLQSGEETPLAHGRGLGLWLAYWIVTNLEGQLDVIEAEAGTTVEIRLPGPS
jgi:PAS domain S-box-containing protein